MHWARTASSTGNAGIRLLHSWAEVHMSVLLYCASMCSWVILQAAGRQPQHGARLGGGLLEGVWAADLGESDVLSVPFADPRRLTGR